MRKKTPPPRSRPEFGKDYDLGWVGFVHGPSLLSTAISYITRRDKAGDIVVTHSFLVSGPDECVEANFPAGVVASGLAESYFDKEVEVIFRRPRGLTKAAAGRLVKRVKAEVGAPFDTAGMVAEGLAGTFLGHFLNAVFGDKPKKLAAKLLHEKGKWVCCDLVMHCLRGERKYRGRGVLSEPVGTVSPQTLFEDEGLFEPLPIEVADRLPHPKH